MDHSELDKRRIRREGTALVVVDVQERLAPVMEPAVLQRTVQNIRLLLEAGDLLRLPIITFEQYPQGLGRTLPELARAREGLVFSKMAFSCCGEERFLANLAELGAKNIILVGMEAHVCVYQSLLDLLAAGYGVHLVRDAICSRHKVDYLTALDNARGAGAIVTTAETVLFQLLQRAGTPEFKAFSALVKGR